MFRLRELREEKGISQKELGKLFNVAQNTISNWENGTREPDTKTLVKLAELFECSAWVRQTKSHCSVATHTPCRQFLKRRQ